MTKPTPRKMHCRCGCENVHTEDEYCAGSGCVPVEPQEPGIEQKTMRMMRQPKIEGRDHTENEYCIEKECVPVGLQITETLAASHSRAIPEAELERVAEQLRMALKTRYILRGEFMETDEILAILRTLEKKA